MPDGGLLTHVALHGCLGVLHRRTPGFGRVGNIGCKYHCRSVGHVLDSTAKPARGGASMTVEEVIEKIQEVKSDFEMEEEHGLLQRDLHNAEMALAGKYVCERIFRALVSNDGMTLFRPPMYVVVWSAA